MDILLRVHESHQLLPCGHEFLQELNRIQLLFSILLQIGKIKPRKTHWLSNDQKGLETVKYEDENYFTWSFLKIYSTKMDFLELSFPKINSVWLHVRH